MVQNILFIYARLHFIIRTIKYSHAFASERHVRYIFPDNLVNVLFNEQITLEVLGDNLHDLLVILKTIDIMLPVVGKEM